ncbi:MAG: hypothetical protein R2862_05710 [Thermoanaerobaculia bacterium]
MSQALRHAAGNFYINDKPTGAVVESSSRSAAPGLREHQRQGRVGGNLCAGPHLARTIRRRLSPDVGSISAHGG